MAETMERNGLMYTRIGDFWFPNLVLKAQIEKTEEPFGRWCRERVHFLREYRKPIYESMLLSDTLSDHLREIERTAEAYKELLMTELMKEAGVTEKLKEENTMEWIGRVNNCLNRAEEIIRNELIYT